MLISNLIIKQISSLSSPYKQMISLSERYNGKSHTFQILYHLRCSPTICPDGRVGLVRKLHEKYRDKYSSDTFDESNRQIDTELQEQPIQKKKRSINEQLKTPKQTAPKTKRQKKKEYER